MSSAQQGSYLQSKVLTAPPHRLHLMLLEGAIRFGRQAEELLRCGDTAAADEPLVRVLDIVGELLVGVRAPKLQVNQQLAELYWFLFRRVSEVKIHADSEKLAETLRLLEYERQTWQLVCDKLAEESKPLAASREHHAVVSAPLAGPRPKGATSGTGGFSLEA